MPAHRSTAERRSRSTDTRSRRTMPPDDRPQADARSAPSSPPTRARAPSRRSFPQQSVRPGQSVRLRAEGLRPPAPRPRQGLHPVRLPRPPSAYPRLRRHVRAEHHRRARRDHSPGAQLRIDTAELARMYERAYLDDMRALRNDSVDVYPRAATTLTKWSARSRACSRRARVHQGAQLDAQLVGSLIALAVRRGPTCRGRASEGSRVPCRCWSYVLRRGFWTVSMCAPGICHDAASS